MVHLGWSPCLVLFCTLPLPLQRSRGPLPLLTPAQALPTGFYGSKFLALKGRYGRGLSHTPSACYSAYRIQA